jgi:predicted metal-binding protein
MSETSGITKRIKELEKFALKSGAHRAKSFSARSVVIDERVRMKCQIPLCPHFGRTLTCPPNIPTVEEFGKALRLYSKALLLQTMTPLVSKMESYDKEEVKEFFKNPVKKSKKKGGAKAETDDFGNVKNAAKRLHELVNEVELKAMGLGFHYALGLIGGECMLCAECVGVGSPHACRRPYEARPSMEGVGIDVIKTCLKAGLPFEIPPKEEIVWSGLVLID